MERGGREVNLVQGVDLVGDRWLRVGRRRLDGLRSERRAGLGGRSGPRGRGWEGGRGREGGRGDGAVLSGVAVASRCQPGDSAESRQRSSRRRAWRVWADGRGAICGDRCIV
jgi:hypothetical protein